MNRIQLSGALVFIGVSTFGILLLIAEALRPSYSVSLEYISSLGVGANAILFNSAIIFMGALIIISALNLILSGWRSMWVWTTVIAGVGAMGVGLFPSGSPYSLHVIFSAVVFGFSGLSAVFFVTVRGTLLRIFSPSLGVIVLASLGLYATNQFLSLGTGGMERMIAYPAILWAMSLAGYLLGHQK